MIDPDGMAKMLELGGKRLLSMARGTAADKIDWKPAETARTVRDIVGEACQGPKWAAIMLRDRTAVEVFSREFGIAEEDERWAWEPWDEFERHLDQNIELLMAEIRRLKPEEYRERIPTPFDMTFSVFDTAQWPLENIHYHMGQVAYIQTLYGDRDEHGYMEADIEL